MAAALPAIILTYELLFRDYTAKQEHIKANSIKIIFESIQQTIPYWSILCLYLCVRKMLLGDFITEYPVIIPITPSGLLHGLHIIFAPLSITLIDNNCIIYKLWHFVLVSVILLTMITTIKIRKNNKMLWFVFVWFLLSLAPTYQVFSTLMDNSRGQRLAYLASAPLCVFLTYGLSYFCINKRFAFINRLITVFFYIFIAGVLYANNLDWAKAGNLSNQLAQGLKSYYRYVSGDPLIYITGIPKSACGIFYLPIGPFNLITKKPVIDRDIVNCVCLDLDKLGPSPGLIKEAIAHKQPIDLLYWDCRRQRLKPVMSPLQNETTLCWQGERLKRILTVPIFHHFSEPQARWLNNNTLEVISNYRRSKCTILEFDLQETPCWNIDFLVLKLQLNKLENFDKCNAEVFFTNDIVQKYSKEYFAEYFDYRYCNVLVKDSDKEQEIIFPLRNLPAWTMGGRCHNIRIVLPNNCILKVKALSIIKAATLMPIIKLQLPPNTPIGKIILGKQHTTHQILYNAQPISRCNQVLLEAIELPDCASANNKKVMLTKIIPGSKGSFVLQATDFPQRNATYSVTLKALDKTGSQIGFPSDHFFVVTGFAKQAFAQSIQ